MMSIHLSRSKPEERWVSGSEFDSSDDCSLETHSRFRLRGYHLRPRDCSKNNDNIYAKHLARPLLETVRRSDIPGWLRPHVIPTGREVFNYDHLR
jgi:hypothetical protein